MKLSQSHVVASVGALVVLAAISGNSMIGMYTSKSTASAPKFDPKAMVGSRDFVNNLLKLLAEVDGESGSAQRLASARRAEKAVLTIEAKIDRPWTKEGKDKLALIQTVRNALKEDMDESAGNAYNPSEIATMFTLFACGMLGWASTKWVNNRYAHFVQSKATLKIKATAFEDLDEFDETPIRRKGSVTPKGLRKSGMSTKNPKSRAKSVRRQQTSITSQDGVEAEPFSMLAVSPPCEEPYVSASEVEGTLATTVKTCNSNESFVVNGADFAGECNVATTSDSQVFQVSDEKKSDAQVVNQRESEYEQGGAPTPTDDCMKDLDCEDRSNNQTLEERTDEVDDNAANSVCKEPRVDDMGCVYAPCEPGGPLQKFWPVIITGEQFYTDGKQIFQMACLPAPAASKEDQFEPDGSTTTDAEDGVSTASDSDVFSQGVTMARSQSEPSFPTQWIE